MRDLPDARCPFVPIPGPARRPRRGVGVAIAAVLVAWLGGGRVAVGQVTTIGAHPKQPFPAGVAKPLVIHVGMILIDFARVNGREESFDMQAYLTSSWVDPALARKPGEPRGARRFPPESFWTPNYEFSNAVEPVKVQNEAALVVEDDGRITQRLRIVGKFSGPMNLRRFPFDEQDLEVLIEPFEREVDEVVLAVDPAKVSRLMTAFLSDWMIEGVSANVRSEHRTTIERTNSRMTFTIRIRRRSTFYLWRVLMPMILLVLTSWVVFRFDPTSLQPLISTAVAVLLNVILFNFTIDFALPKVAYLTFIDACAITCFLFMLATVLLVTRIHLTCNRKGPDAARSVQARAARVMPIAFGLVVLAEGLYFLA